MRLSLKILLFTAAATLASSAIAINSGALQSRVEGPSWVYTTRGNYNEVRQDLVDAIESRGLVVSYMAHTQNMLQRTAEAVGVSSSPYHAADTLLFCSAELTHKLLIANPHHMPLCPYSISVYTLMQEPDIVYLAIRSPVKNVPVYEEIHKLLEGIIYDTIEW